MKIKESFAVEATEEVRKDKRFDWYVNWLRSLENKQFWSNRCDLVHYGIGSNFKCGDWVLTKDKIITLDEVFKRYGKEIYEANGIDQPKESNPKDHVPVLAKISHYNDLGKSTWFEVVYYCDGWQSYSGSKTFEDGEQVVEWEYCDKEDQPFQGSREHDEKLLDEWLDFCYGESLHPLTIRHARRFLNNRYGNESILKQIAEKEAEIEELKKQLI